MVEYSIVIAEDDMYLRELYLRKFKPNTYDVRTACNGQEALTLIEAQPPDLLLLDINMPVLDGFAVLEKLPKERRRFPVVLLTNNSDPAHRERGAALGADDYFVKTDMSVSSLLKMVERLLQQGKTD